MIKIGHQRGVQNQFKKRNGDFIEFIVETPSKPIDFDPPKTHKNFPGGVGDFDPQNPQKFPGGDRGFFDTFWGVENDKKYSIFDPFFWIKKNVIFGPKKVIKN